MPSQTLKVLLICRSNTRSCIQLPPSENPLQDQEVRLREWLSRNFDGAVDVHVMSIRQERRSGNALLDPFVDKLREGCDLVLLETLSDVGRGFDVYRFF